MQNLKFKVKIFLIDSGKNVYEMKGVYDTQTELAEVKKSRFSRSKAIERFNVNPNHVYYLWEGKFRKKRKAVIFIDNSKRESVSVKRVREIIEDGKKRKEEVEEKIEVAKSVQMDSGKPVNQKKRTKLDYLTLQAFWESLKNRNKIPLKYTLITLLAGAGGYHVMLVVLRVFGFNV